MHTTPLNAAVQIIGKSIEQRKTELQFLEVQLSLTSNLQKEEQLKMSIRDAQHDIHYMKATIIGLDKLDGRTILAKGGTHEIQS